MYPCRYVGRIAIGSEPPNLDAIRAKANAIRKQSNEVTRSFLILDSKKKTVKVATRTNVNDVLFMAYRDTVYSFGLEPGNGNFLLIVVYQGDQYWLHALNMRQEPAQEGSAAMQNLLGGTGDLQALASFKPSKAAKMDRKMSKKGPPAQGKEPARRGSKGSAPPARAQPAPPPQQALTAGNSRRFVGYYLGSVPVQELFGTEVVRKAVAVNTRHRMKLNAEDKTAGLGDPAIVEVTMEVVRTIDRHTGHAMFTEFIKNISYTCVLDAVDSTDIFAYIGVNKQLGVINCYIYHVPKGSGNMAYQAINQAFKLLADDEKTRGTNPFAVTDPKREPAPELLYRRQIHRGDLKAIQQIGAGQFGSVYTATQRIRIGKDKWAKEPVMRAVKLLRNAANADDKEEFTREAETMLPLDHPNLVKMIGVAVQQKPWLCVLEYMKYGDLKSFLSTCREKKMPLRYGEILSFGKQLASGMAYIASKRMVHMDLAARNALVGEGNIIKVADFGLTRPYEEGKNHMYLREPMKLALKWISIEGMDKKLFSEKSDVWAFGVTLWEIASYGNTPYGQVKTAQIQESVRGGLRLSKPGTCPQGFYDVMHQCWESDMAIRPNFANLEAQLDSLIAANPCPVRDVGATLSSNKAGKGANQGPPSRRTSVDGNPVPAQAPADPNGSVSRRGGVQSRSTAAGLLAHSAAAGDPSSSISKGKHRKSRRSSSSSTPPPASSVMHQLTSAMSSSSSIVSNTAPDPVTPPNRRKSLETPPEPPRRPSVDTKPPVQLSNPSDPPSAKSSARASQDKTVDLEAGGFGFDEDDEEDDGPLDASALDPALAAEAEFGFNGEGEDTETGGTGYEGEEDKVTTPDTPSDNNDLVASEESDYDDSTPPPREEEAIEEQEA
eukprot:TRINITY_DN11867_c1_g1_i9.p1 TRINITY_DN11867_c1_g1~~TRINITY_DN11867_c1_g1_i9.p1  ORF type:complete len:890 (+),score=245.21 TRINITY_DN11867_c1_g1_i9:193-2862(+)